MIGRFIIYKYTIEKCAFDSPDEIICSVSQLLQSIIIKLNFSNPVISEPHDLFVFKQLHSS